MATEKLTSIIDLAEELGMHKQTIFKVLSRLQIQPQKQRDPTKRNQIASFVTQADVAKITKECEEIARKGQRIELGMSPEDGGTFSSEIGVFYMIQLEPNHDPGRFKLGFTSDLAARLQKHRCSAPFAFVLKSWPCRRTWERAAIDCLTIGYEQLHTEVFRSTSIADVVIRGDGFFKVMPNISNEADENEVVTA